MAECWTCGGTGVVIRTYKDKNGVTQREEKRCPTCGGTGEYTPKR